MKKYILETDLLKGEEVSEKFAEYFPEFVEEIEVGRWKPKHNEKYFYVSEDGRIVVNRNHMNSEGDKYRIFTGNCYETIEEAKKELERLKALAELRELAEGYEWKYGESNWHIYWSGYRRAFFASVESGAKGTRLHFESQGKAQHAIDTLGEEKLKLIFRIES